MKLIDTDISADLVKNLLERTQVGIGGKTARFSASCSQSTWCRGVASACRPLWDSRVLGVSLYCNPGLCIKIQSIFSNAILVAIDS